MRTINVETNTEKIFIGRVGENEATEIVFKISKWHAQFGDGTFSLLHQRSRDAAPYPCEIEQTGDEVKWVIRSADTAMQGSGKCELIYAADNAVVKSAIYKTIVDESISGGADPPEPWESWVDRVLDAGNRVDEFLHTLEGGTTGQVWTKNEDTAQWADPQGGGAGSWNELTGKPFNSIGENLKVVNGVLSVDTAPNVEQDNTKPITSAAVYVEVGNINALLALI